MKTVQDLIQQNRIADAIKIITQKIDVNTGILLSARWNELQRNQNSGIYTPSEYSIGRNKIINSILYTCGFDNITTDTKNTQMVNTLRNDDDIKQKLNNIIITNKRKNVEFSDRALKLLNEYQEYEKELMLNPTYDVTKRKYRSFVESVSKLTSLISENNLDSKESVIARIYKLIEPTIPDYKSLTEAYKLSSGYGFVDSYVKEQLNNQPNDNNVKIEIAERIELFISSNISI
jgi:hypothetical protein